MAPDDTYANRDTYTLWITPTGGKREKARILWQARQDAKLRRAKAQNEATEARKHREHLARLEEATRHEREVAAARAAAEAKERERAHAKPFVVDTLRMTRKGDRR